MTSQRADFTVRIDFNFRRGIEGFIEERNVFWRGHGNGGLCNWILYSFITFL